MTSERKVVVITGASRGIGAQLSKAYRHIGYQVIASSRSMRKSDDPAILVIEGDITRPDGLLTRHTSRLGYRARGAFGKELLDQLKDYVVAHLDEPIEVAALARIAGRSPFHFTRVFTRSVGMTPHRYVVHLRLQQAIELVRDGQSSLAEIAARTGVADQSHLSRWVRRVHGVSLTQLAV
jgi:AraC-like DNA-binding protein